MHIARLLALSVALVAAGCTFPGQDQEATEDVGGDYESGLGVSLAVTNEAGSDAQVTLRLVDTDGNEIGRDNMTLEPGSTAVRRYGVDERMHVVASVAYSFDAGGRAAGGMDEQSLDLLECDELTRASWRLVAVEETFGSQWLGTTCEPASG